MTFQILSLTVGRARNSTLFNLLNLHWFTRLLTSAAANNNDTEQRWLSVFIPFYHVALTNKRNPLVRPQNPESLQYSI